MNRCGFSYVLGTLVLPLVLASPILAQTSEVDEQVIVSAYDPTESVGKTFACPGNVPVGERAVRFSGSVMTTSENGVSYEVLIRYGPGADPAGAMEHRDLTTSIGAWSDPDTTDGVITLELEVKVTPGQPLDWAAELWGKDAGNVFHIWRTKSNGTTTRDETCEYLIVGIPDLAITIDRTGQYWVDEPLGKGESSSENAGPDPGYFEVPANSEIDLKILVANEGDDANEYGVAGGMGPLETGVGQLFEIISVEPSNGAAIECVITGNDDSFTCDGVGLPSDEEVEIVVRYKTVERGLGGVSVGGGADGEENFANNNDFGPIVVIGGGIIIYRKKIRTGLPGGGLGNDQFGPGNGYTVDLFDSGDALVGTGITMPIDYDGDGIPEEQGVTEFDDLPNGTYRVKERPHPGTVPVDPPSGEITGIVILDGNVVEVEQKNEGELDWGDLPDPYERPSDPDVCQVQCYPTDTPGGASHIVSDDVFLGAQVDANPTPIPHRAARGDDELDGNDDEDGLVSFSVLSGGMGRMEVRSTLSGVIPGPFEVLAWIDLDNDGILERAERVGHAVLPIGASGAITTVFEFPVPSGSWIKFARIRVGFAMPELPIPQPENVHDVKADGHWAIGEVEDYFLPQKGIDYGDAPELEDDSRNDVPFGYPTTFALGGAYHITVQDEFFAGTIPSDKDDFRIGDRVDGEGEGQQSTEADGDDNSDLYDEDGIRFAAGFIPVRAVQDLRENTGVRITYGFASGSNATFVPLANRDGKMDAWIDFNRDGDWEDPGEQIADNISVQGGPNFTPITFSIPDTAQLGWTFGRFRFSLAGGLDFTGGADTGEVEDYLLMILPNVLRIASLADSGPGTVRETIETANVIDTPDPVYIVYEPEEGVGKTSAVIMLESPLPAIERPMIISGGGSLVIDGSQAGEDADGLVVTGGSSGIHGLTIQGFSGHAINLASADNVVSDNVLIDNAGDGVQVGAFTGNRILTNEISGNGGLGIDIGGDGPTANDDGDLDGIQNHPIITSVVRGSTTIEGSLLSNADADFLIQFFTNETCDDSGSGEGSSFLAATEVTTDGVGSASFEVVLEETLPKDLAVVATATGPSGTSEFSECSRVTRVERDPVESVPTSFSLDANYPNPFAVETTIPFDISEAGRVRLEIFNAVGQVVETAVDASMSAGRYRVSVHAGTLPSGVYYYRLTTESFVKTRKMIVVR